MTSTAELDRIADQAIQHYNNGEYGTYQTLFSSLMMSACFADGTEDEHVDRIVRLLEARPTTTVIRSNIRRHVEMILTGMSEPTDRFAGFSLLLRNFS